MPEPSSPYPARPALRPGVRVTRRDDGHLQVGLDRELAIVVADTEEVRRALRELTLGEPPGRASVALARLATDLLGRGLVVDAAALMADLPADAVRRHAVAAVHADHGLAGAAQVQRRRTARVEVEAPEPVAGLARHLLDLCGVGAAGASDSPDALLLAGLGEPDRDRLDDLLRRSVPYVGVHVVEGFVRLGPFVVPGRTACHRCVDAHLTDADPRHPVVVQQLVEVADRARLDGIPEPADPAVVCAAVAWAVRDLVAWIDGAQPETWSATVRLGPGLRQARTDWLRHARCGCAWGEGLAAG